MVYPPSPKKRFIRFYKNRYANIIRFSPLRQHPGAPSFFWKTSKTEKELVPQKKYREDPNGAGDGVVRIGVAPLALIHVMEAARGAARRLHTVFVHHAVTQCKIAAAFARKFFFRFRQFLYGVFDVLCYTESGKNP
jgi:hypothetical protein